jgi:hypothetical protein
LAFCIQNTYDGQMSSRCDQMSDRAGRPVSWHDPGVLTLTDPELADRLDTSPDLVLPALAEQVRRVSAALHPADLVTFCLDGGVFVLGRHELAGLAMLFEEWNLDPDTRAVSLARARGYLLTATLLPASP